jgi:hypothetical protein
MGRLQIHFQQNYQTIVRNRETWGKLYSREDRPVMRFIDVEKQAILEGNNLHWVDLPPADNHSIGILAGQIHNLESGSAVAVNHAFFPKRTRRTDIAMKWANRVVYRLSKGVRLDYPTNRLHNFVVNFVEPPGMGVADYYLNLSVKNGVSIIVKA